MKWILSVLCCIGLLIGSVCLIKNYMNTETIGMISWSDEVFEQNERSTLLETLEELEVSSLYQHFSKDIPLEEVKAFIDEMEQREIDVYLITGDPEWGTDPSGEQMIEQIAYAADLKQQLGNPECFRGVLMDTEPYLTEQWDTDAQHTMEAFVSGMKKTYQYAKQQHITLIGCIPYFYDQKGFEKEVKELIAEGMDAVAVMNYFKKDELGQIKTEADYAKQANKPLLVLYEFQQPGKYDLSERNTYYHDGIDAAKESFYFLKKELGMHKMEMVFHEYNSVREMLENE